jgi:hypothetical protein
MTPPIVRRLETIWMLLADDGGGEGLLVDESDYPCIANDQESLDYLLIIAEEITAKSKQTVRLVKFTQREEVQVFVPVSGEELAA